MSTFDVGSVRFSQDEFRSAAFECPEFFRLCTLRLEIQLFQIKFNGSRQKSRKQNIIAWWRWHFDSRMVDRQWKAYRQFTPYCLTSGHPTSQFRSNTCLNGTMVCMVTESPGRRFHTFTNLVLMNCDLTNSLDRDFAGLLPRPYVWEYKSDCIWLKKGIWDKTRQAVHDFNGLHQVNSAPPSVQREEI